MSKTTIDVRLVIRGIHFWPEAEEMQPEVGFLKYPHAHHFSITCKKQVTEANREIELFQFKRTVELTIQKVYGSNSKYPMFTWFGASSCEMIAEKLVKELDLISASVYEDEFIGSTVTND